MCTKKFVSFSIIIICFCYLLHACNARPLGFTTGSNFHQNDDKPISSMKFSENAREALKRSETICRRKKSNEEEKTGIEDCKSFLVKDSLKAINSKGSSWPRFNIEDKVFHSFNFSEEDLAATDYQPPHRKSPIHNK